MTVVLSTIAVVLASIAYFLREIAQEMKSGALRGPEGPVGPQGPRGIPGSVHITAAHPEESSKKQRFEVLRGGFSTGHFVCDGEADYDEAFRTPGLSLKSEDGTVIEGVQG